MSWWRPSACTAPSLLARGATTGVAFRDVCFCCSLPAGTALRERDGAGSGVRGPRGSGLEIESWRPAGARSQACMLADRWLLWKSMDFVERSFLADGASGHAEMCILEVFMMNLLQGISFGSIENPGSWASRPQVCEFTPLFTTTKA